MFATANLPRPKTSIEAAFPTVPSSGPAATVAGAAPARAHDLWVTRLRRAGSGTARSLAPERRLGHAATAEPPDRYDDFSGSAGWSPRPPAPSGPLSYPPVVYQESVQIPVSDERHLPAARQERAIPAVPQNGTVSRPRQRVRGMNAALETGVAGVGEMAPARKPARPRQMVVAVVVAVVGLTAGALTYKSLASGPVSFSGEVVQNAPCTRSASGRRARLRRSRCIAGQHVTAGQILATQDGSLAQVNLQATKDARAAAAAALYADEHPQQSNLTVEQNTVASERASLASVTARASSTDSRNNGIVSQRQQSMTLDKASLARQMQYTPLHPPPARPWPNCHGAAGTDPGRPPRPRVAGPGQQQVRVDARAAFSEREAALHQCPRSGRTVSA